LTSSLYIFGLITEGEIYNPYLMGYRKEEGHPRGGFASLAEKHSSDDPLPFYRPLGM